MHQCQFTALSATEQLQLTLLRGTYLLWRRSRLGSIHLYHLPTATATTGLFVELYYDPHSDLLRIERCFTGSAPLADYLSLVRLPAGLGI